jgi:PTS system nitrogen regulatory IIA component
MQIADFITVSRVLAQMRSTNKEQALVELGELVANGKDERTRDAIVRVLRERERLASTGIGEEIAIPHGKLDAVDSLLLGLGRSRQGVEFESVDGKPTRLFFVLVAPEESTGIHLKALARISRLCKEPEFRARLLEAENSTEMYEILCSEDAKH